MEKNASTPLYQQLAKKIKDQIAVGELKEDDKLMTEQEFSEAYGVSRITVRKALELLADEGIIIKKQGKGTFVAAKKLNRVLDSVMSFSENCRMSGSVASAELLTLEWIKATASLASHLGIKMGDKVLRIRRVRSCDEWKVMLEDNYFPAEYGYLVNENLSQSLYGILRSHGTYPAHFVKRVEICFPNEKEIEELGVKEGQPLLLHRETATDADGKIIHYTRLVINPEHYTLTIRA